MPPCVALPPLCYCIVCAQARGAIFNLADISHAHVTSSVLSHTELRYADLTGTVFEDVDFTCADFQSADLTDVEMYGTSTVADAHFSYAFTQEADFDDLVLRQMTQLSPPGTGTPPYMVPRCGARAPSNRTASSKKADHSRPPKPLRLPVCAHCLHIAYLGARTPVPEAAQQEAALACVDDPDVSCPAGVGQFSEVQCDEDPTKLDTCAHSREWAPCLYHVFSSRAHLSASIDSLTSQAWRGCFQVPPGVRRVRRDQA